MTSASKTSAVLRSENVFIVAGETSCTTLVLGPDGGERQPGKLHIRQPIYTEEGNHSGKH